MDDLALDSDATTVDDSNLAKPALDGLIQIFFNDNWNFPWLECVEVDGVFDRNLVHSIQYNQRL
jgi:hypothetical protein